MTLSSIVAIGVFHNYIRDIPAAAMISESVQSSPWVEFTISTVMLLLLMHIFVAIGLTLLTNSTSSLNAFNRSLQKSLLLYFTSSIFGLLVELVGMTLPSLVLYMIWSVVQNDYSHFNVDLLKITAVSLVVIIIIYPIIAISIKYVLRKKFLRYVEYGYLT